jgi:ABC-type uncharacterized transport system substrate-binding protein
MSTPRLIYFFLLSGFLLLACGGRSQLNSALETGPSPGRTGPEVAVVMSDSQTAYAESASEFRASLEEQCADCRISTYSMHGDQAKGERLFAQLAQSGTKLVYTLGIKATYLATKHMPDRPIIFSSILYLEKYRDQLLSASAQICGVSSRAPISSLFSNIQMMTGGSKTIGVVYSPTRSAALYEHAKTVGVSMGLNLVPIYFDAEQQADDRFIAQLQEVDSVWAVADPVIYEPTNFDGLVTLTRKLKRPLLSYSEAFVERGATFSISVDYSTVGRQAAGMAVAVIQENQQPMDLGIVTPLGTRWVVNQVAVEELGLKIPSFVRQQFDRVVGLDEPAQ